MGNQFDKCDLCSHSRRFHSGGGGTFVPGFCGACGRSKRAFHEFMEEIEKAEKELRERTVENMKRHNVPSGAWPSPDVLFGEVTEIKTDEMGITVTGQVYRDPFAESTSTITRDESKGRTMEEKLVRWFKEHRKEVAIVAITALVTAKFCNRHGYALITEADGTTFAFPMKKN